MAAVITGDQAAAAELFGRYHGRLVRRMRSWTRDAGHADDLAQDAWLKAVVALERFDQRAPFWPWLRCIADNVARSDLRSRLTPEGEHRVICVDDESLAQTASEADEIARVDDGAFVAGALGAIPSRQRDAFLAVAHAGAPMAVAAMRFGVNENAFRQLYHRARQSLRQQVEGTFGTAPVLWWYRMRSSVRDILGVSPATMAQGIAAVAGVVAVVVLAPTLADDARASAGARQEGARAPGSAEERAPSWHDRSSRRGRYRQAPGTQVRAMQDLAAEPPPTARRSQDAAATVVPAPTIHVPALAVRGHQKPDDDPDFHYGARIDVPGVPRQQVGYKAKDSHLEPIHTTACEVAVSTPVTYCDR